MFALGPAAAVALGGYEAPNPAYAPPTSYYNAATGTGTTLLNNLHTITSTGFNAHTYYDSKWADGTGGSDSKGSHPGGFLDSDPNNANNILLIYNRASVDGQWDQGTTWNREHIWPKYWLNLTSTQVTDTYSGPASDFFELRPSNPTVNSTRSNDVYGLYPFVGAGGSWATNSGGANEYFYPGTADTGDAARAIFYMATRYSTYTDTKNGNVTASLTLVNGTPTQRYQMGDLNSLLHWNYSDGVDNFERRRNQLIYGSSGDLTNHALNPTYWQGNRNPFIDHPEYVWAIWGGGNNNSQVHVGNTVAADGSSGQTVSLRVMKNGTFGTGSVTFTKTGANPTTYDLTTSGFASTTAAGTGQPFDYNAQTRTIAVGLSASTSTTGLTTGTVTLNNTDLTTGGAGMGSGDGNDVVTVNGQVVDNRVITASEAAFNRVVIGSNVTTSTTLSSPGSDDTDTRVTVTGAGSADDANGASIVSSPNSQLFNGTFTSGPRQVQANFASPGSKSNSLSFTVSGEGLTGETVNPLSVSYSATAVDHSQPSFDSSSSQPAKTIDFGYVPAGFAPRTAGFEIDNLAAPAGPTLTAGLDVDGVTPSGSGQMTTNVAASSNLAAGQALTYTATFTPDTVAGDNSATHTIAVSDEDIPGGVARPDLVLTTTGRTFTDATFPVTGFLNLLSGETLNTGPMQIADGVTLTKSGPGTMNISGAQSHGTNSTLAVTGGAVNFATNGGANLALGVIGGGSATFDASQHLRGLTIDGASKVDLKNHSLVVTAGDAGTWDGSAYTGLSGLVASGRNGGTWDGVGLYTSVAGGSDYTTIGVATADDIGAAGSIWNGEAVSSGDVLAMYTYGGDANLDGQINIDDYTQIDSSVSVGGILKGWFNGDFNYDGNVDIDDYTIIDSNITIQGPPLAGGAGFTGASAVAAVPEPSLVAASLALLTATVLPSRRRR